MKYVIVLCDGMADEPMEELGGKTPLETAATPNLDRLAPLSEIGMVRTVPEGMSPGSDTANLSVIGYNPREYYTGRSPLEALSIGVDMEQTDVSFRCNIVTLTEEQERYEDRVIVDHSSGEISTEDAAVLVEALKEGLKREGYEFYAGTSYRHLLIWKNGQVVELTPPHDILTRRIGDYLPQDQVLREMMEKSYEILSVHPLNLERKRKGLNPANSAWFWGAGTRPMLRSFEEKNGKKGVMISAVDLLKGIAVGASMHNISVEGANGGLNTNYAGKAKAAADALIQDGYDFAYIHIEAPDEMGHQGNLANKILSIEKIDHDIIGPAAGMLEDAGEDFRMLVLPDHPTPIRVRTHTSDPVPYMLYDSRKAEHTADAYNEAEASETGIREDEGYTLIDHLFEKR
ncbi:cofactor-independent phosphoglycerate mutase [Faecalicatena orotica]|uniref:2,3-bisphosphoglycerate-independent phosphoglycerate mutase n=1 Tax=Faecalicatena orotica TaxID=1544 RepID=A0A2Y9BCJ2_9FIRM|nr:cofactor-independent phosphoglycerate mutase [Faecalicatena orotica]PWJ32153.1 2,3-bisphosphoglycerate-independent phosphoglycerate mutase [Faecalicatena orotica]SSA53986.1 2,3-bisphosphoglycerate-independent phosphoglycerate mutase [Faecalicatena orotica]